MNQSTKAMSQAAAVLVATPLEQNRLTCLRCHPICCNPELQVLRRCLQKHKAILMLPRTSRTCPLYLPQGQAAPCTM